MAGNTPETSAHLPPPPPPPPADAGVQFSFEDIGGAPPPPPPRVKIALPPSPLDVSPIRSSREMELLAELEADATFGEFMAEVRSKHNPDLLRRHLLKSGLKITDKISPPLVKLVETVNRIVDCPMRIELFVEQGERLTSWGAVSTKRDVAYVILSSALIEKIPQRELLFIIGSEVGHLIFGHDRYPIDAVLGMWRNKLAPIHMFKLLAWRRYAEISADRVGLLCCQDYRVASEAFFKLTSGVTSGKLAFNIDDYLQQLVEVQALDDVGDNTDDWFSPHSFSPMRIKALQLFANTDVFQKACRRGVGQLSFRIMEERLDEFMGILFPSFMMAGSSDEGDEIREWLVHAGMLVAYANGELVRQEVDQIVKIVGHQRFTQKFEKMADVDPNELFTKVEQLVAPIRMKVIPAQRCQMMRDLVLIAAADGAIDEHEFGALYDIAELLDVPQEFVDGVADELLGNEDSIGPSF
ncbi:MAG: M48 family metallopeptidase [Planctomycetota bacterium]